MSQQSKQVTHKDDDVAKRERETEKGVRGGERDAEMCYTKVTQLQKYISHNKYECINICI